MLVLVALVETVLAAEMQVALVVAVLAVVAVVDEDSGALVAVVLVY
jgi:hypothetical protein